MYFSHGLLGPAGEYLQKVLHGGVTAARLPAADRRWVRRVGAVGDGGGRQGEEGVLGGSVCVG